MGTKKPTISDYRGALGNAHREITGLRTDLERERAARTVDVENLRTAIETIGTMTQQRDALVSQVGELRDQIARLYTERDAIQRSHFEREAHLRREIARLAETLRRRDDMIANDMIAQLIKEG
jgi:regulator of replication initiation timing